MPRIDFISMILFCGGFAMLAAGALFLWADRKTGFRESPAT
jgi:hypothetical protein